MNVIGQIINELNKLIDYLIDLIDLIDLINSINGIIMHQLMILSVRERFQEPLFVREPCSGTFLGTLFGHSRNPSEIVTCSGVTACSGIAWAMP